MRRAAGGAAAVTGDDDPAWSVAVVVPARDEAALLPRCLASLSAAAARVRGVARVHVAVVADSCHDGTEAVAAHALAAADASIVRIAAGNVGVARAAGAAAALRALPPTAPERVWIAMTDADSRVPAEWLRAHLAAARRGWWAVAGGIAVDDWGVRPRGLAARLTHYRRTQRDAGTRPVHGANLGVSAAALRAVGGVPQQALSEDAALVAVLEAARVPVRWDPDLVVHTSARRSGRAPGGFATLLDELETR